MEFEGEFSVATGPSETWEFLLDPEDLGACIPNAHDIDVVDEDTFTAQVGVKVSHMSVTFATNVEILERRPEEYLKVHITGQAEGNDSRMEATGELELSPREGTGTDIRYKNTLNVSGRIMTLGSRIIERVGERQTNKTISNLQNELGPVEENLEV